MSTTELHLLVSGVKDQCILALLFYNRVLFLIICMYTAISDFYLDI